MNAQRFDSCVLSAYCFCWPVDVVSCQHLAEDPAAPSDNTIPVSSRGTHCCQQRLCRPLSNQLKAFFGPKWKDALLGNALADGQQAGSPKVLVIAASAKRCVEVLK
jgi:hypothetical protein